MKFFYFDDEDEIPKKEVVRRKKNQKKIEENDKQVFSFDNEIIIGVTKNKAPKKQLKKELDNEKQVKEVKKEKKETKKSVSKRNNKNKEQKTKNKGNLNKKKRKIRNIIKYIILIVLFVSVILCAMFSPLFNVKTIEVIGNEKITKNEIISLSQIQLEENTFKLSKDKIINQIKENAYINEVFITRKLPSNITITVEERKAAYLLEYATGYIYLDKQGYMLEINSAKLDLPILQGASTETSEFMVGNRLCVEDLEKLSTLTRVMELAQLNGLANIISRIDIENKQNIKLLFESKDKIAYLGDSTNLIEKISWVKKIIEDNEGKPGEIFVNMDLNKENPIFRERV